MHQLSRILRINRVPRALLWMAALLILTLVALNTSVTWAAPVTRPLNQTVPTPQTTYLPKIAPATITACELNPNANVCRLLNVSNAATIAYHWAPDGSTMAYAISLSGESEAASGLYEVSAQGTNPRQLLNLDRINWIRYSPDNTMIAFVKGRPVENEYLAVYDLYIYTRATGETRQLSDGTSNEISYLAPNWSPDSSKLVFTRHQHTNATGDIYTIRPDGSELTPLTSGPTNEHQASYSPDGTRIVYAESRSGDPNVLVSIAVMNADGSEATNLTYDMAPFTNNPVWSADGNSIFFFTSTANDAWDIYRINADGTNPVNLTNDALQQDEFALSPDGSKIVFVGRTDINTGLIDLYTMDVDGSNITKYTNPHGKGTYPTAVTWNPDGQRFTYIVPIGGISLYLMRAD